MVDNLKRKTISALSWSFIETIAGRSVQFIVGITLARLLFPEQFGLIGMLTIFIEVMRTFLEGGFGSALIQKQDATQTDINSIFYFNILVGFAAAGLLCLVAPWIAAFYNQPVLTPLTRALSLTMVINSFGMIQGTMLQKEINFKSMTQVSLIASVLSGIIGISLAAKGFGVWSLVAQQITSSLFGTIAVWLFSPWRPALGEQIGLDERFRAAGRTALVSMGLDPGMSTVLGKAAAATLDAVDAVRLRTASVDGRGVRPFPLYSREAFLEDTPVADTVLVLDALVEVLRMPVFPEEELDKERKRQVGVIRQRQEQTSVRAYAAVLRRIYPPEHPLHPALHYRLAVLIEHRMREGHDSAIGAPGLARRLNLHPHAHGVPREQRPLEREPIDRNQRQADAMDASAQDYQPLGERKGQRAGCEAAGIDRVLLGVGVRQDLVRQEGHELGPGELVGATSDDGVVQCAHPEVELLAQLLVMRHHRRERFVVGHRHGSSSPARASG